MFYRKDAVFVAVAGLLASAGFAMAGTNAVKTPALSLEPTVITAAAEDTTPPAAEPLGSNGLLMQGLDKIGAEKTLNDYGINIYGWIEGGYTYNHRHDRGGVIGPGPFNHEFGNHMMLNQVDLRIERMVDGSKWDVGGLIDVMYGSDAARIHSSGLGFNGSDPTDNNSPSDPRAVANVHPAWQFDLPQAYVDVGIPVGNGLKIRAGKFYTLLGYEHVEAPANTFYSHSYLFSMIPFTQTGVLGFYKINDQFDVVGGFTRGWNETLEDNNAAIDFVGQVNYKINNQFGLTVNTSVGPQNDDDSSHYRIVVDPILTFKATDALSFAAEGLYAYDGGRNGSGSVTHAYGDTWGLALYGTYVFNDYVSLSARAEKAHFDVNSVTNLTSAGLSSSLNNNQQFAAFGSFAQTNFYALTLGTTITPFPKDPIGRNLSIRPEVRYDYCEDHVFSNGNGKNFKDQLTFGADVIFKF